MRKPSAPMNPEVKPLNPAITDSTNLKRLFALILMTLVSSVAGCGEPPVEFVNTANARQIIDNEKWIVINYWALWCAPSSAGAPNAEDDALDFDVAFDVEYGEMQSLSLIHISEPTRLLRSRMPSSA